MRFSVPTMLPSESLSKGTKPKAPKLLAVDDLPDNLFLMDVILGDEDHYQLSCVNSGQAALDAVEACPPDLILLDVMMPGMTGYEVTRRIRQNPALPYIPILLVTAHDEVSFAEGLDAGADGFIRKPFDIQELLDRVHAALIAGHED